MSNNMFTIKNKWAQLDLPMIFMLILQIKKAFNINRMANRYYKIVYYYL
jgi:hypothetical protein